MPATTTLRNSFASRDWSGYSRDRKRSLISTSRHAPTTSSQLRRDIIGIMYRAHWRINARNEKRLHPFWYSSSETLKLRREAKYGGRCCYPEKKVPNTIETRSIRRKTKPKTRRERSIGIMTMITVIAANILLGNTEDFCTWRSIDKLLAIIKLWSIKRKLRKLPLLLSNIAGFLCWFL